MPGAASRSFQHRSLAGPAALLVHSQFANDGLARDGALTQQDLGSGSGRKINVDPASETDQADALACLHLVAFLDQGHDPASDAAGDLGEADPDAVAALHEEMLPLI